MKNKTVIPKRLGYVVVICMCLGYIFFRKNGLSDIKLGMDLAGGVRLTYHVDYSKYENQYTDQAELVAAKKTARDIITRQIDNRISQLGVSNYEAKSQLIDGEEYIVIELGGVPDVDAAKSIIGKTVELEFGLENSTSTGESQVARSSLADKIFVQAKETDADWQTIGTSNSIQGVSYFSLSGDKSSLPTVYKDSSLLDTLEQGAIASTIVKGVFQDYPVELEQYGFEDQKGYTITRLVDRGPIARMSYDLGAFLATVPDATKTLTIEPANVNTGAAYIDGEKIIYPVGAILPGKAGYNIEIYKYNGDQNLNTVQAQLAEGKVFTGVNQTYKGWLAQESTSLAVPGFAYVEGQEWTVLSGEVSTIVRVTNSKKADQTMFEQYEYTADITTLQSLKNTLENPITYQVEALFIADKQPRKTATDPKSGVILNGAFFENAQVSTTQLGQPAVGVQFNDKGREIFCNITEANVNKQMAIFVGGEIKTNPVINEKICGGQTQISGSFTREEAQNLARDLNEGALPAPLILAQEEKVSPVLGAQALRHILQAGLVGVIGVMFYMLFAYGWRYALISGVILVSFAVILIATLKLMGAVLGLSGLAAIILTLGMSVDATILVFERIQENLKKGGSSYRDAVLDARHQARSAVRDGNVSTGLIALLLFTMGVSIFRGFGTMMLLTIIIILLLVYPMISEVALIIGDHNKK